MRKFKESLGHNCQGKQLNPTEKYSGEIIRKFRYEDSCQVLVLREPRNALSLVLRYFSQKHLIEFNENISEFCQNFISKVQKDSWINLFLIPQETSFCHNYYQNPYRKCRCHSMRKIQLDFHGTTKIISPGTLPKHLASETSRNFQKHFLRNFYRGCFRNYWRSYSIQFTIII